MDAAGKRPVTDTPLASKRRLKICFKLDATLFSAVSMGKTSKKVLYSTEQRCNPHARGLRGPFNGIYRKIGV
jgi:hypothetical protein